MCYVLWYYFRLRYLPKSETCWNYWSTAGLFTGQVSFPSPSHLLTYLDLVPVIPSGTSGNELSPSGTVAGSISRVTPVYTHHLFQHILPCPHWSSNPSAAFWDPFHSQTSWSGCWESQNVTNKSSSSGRYYVVQCQLSISCHHFVICNVVTPWNAQPVKYCCQHLHVEFVGHSWEPPACLDKRENSH